MHFSIRGAAWSFSFSANVIETMSRYRQTLWYHKETIGQLYSADLTGTVVHIAEATVLSKVTAARTRVSFDPLEAEQEREGMFAQGLHCIGFWHTHPEPIAAPSRIDQDLAADHAIAVQSVLNGLCFVIVGTKLFPSGWYIGLHDGATFHRLSGSTSVELDE